MDLLPSEILNEILLLVDRPSILLASKVCHQWQSLSLGQVVPIKSEDVFREVCRRGDSFSLSKSRFRREWVELGLIIACGDGHPDLVKLFIEKGASNWNYGLHAACAGGHPDLAKFMIEKGANDWNGGLYHACRDEQLGLVKFMIEKGATNWDRGLSGACRGGHLELVKLFIEKGAADWNGGLDHACWGGHLELIKFMIEKGASSCYCGKSVEEHLS